MSKETRVIFDTAMELAQADVILYWGPRLQNRFNDIFEEIECVSLGIVTRFVPGGRENGYTTQFIIKEVGRNLVWTVESGTHLFEALNKLERPFFRFYIPTLRTKKVFCVQPLCSANGYSYQKEIKVAY